MGHPAPESASVAHRGAGTAVISGWANPALRACPQEEQELGHLGPATSGWTGGCAPPTDAPQGIRDGPGGLLRAAQSRVVRAWATCSRQSSQPANLAGVFAVDRRRGGDGAFQTPTGWAARVFQSPGPLVFFNEPES